MKITMQGDGLLFVPTRGRLISNSARCFITHRAPTHKETFRWDRYKGIVRKISAKGFEKKKDEQLGERVKKGFDKAALKIK